jgi:DNA-binding YbaB/EbfC family protein
VSAPDLSKLLERAQQMQARMQTLQRDLAARSVEGSSGGGMVTAVATGELRILEVRIEPALFSSGDQAMLQDLVAAAVNEALSRAQAMVQGELQRVQQEMQGAAGGIPLMGSPVGEPGSEG